MLFWHINKPLYSEVACGNLISFFLMEWGGLRLPPFYRWGKKGPENLSGHLKVTELLSGEFAWGTWAQFSLCHPVLHLLKYFYFNRIRALC